MNNKFSFFGLFFSLFIWPFLLSAEPVKVVDDVGFEIELNQPAERVVSLSPHITELLYAVGGSEKIIAAVEYSNFPIEAKKLPRVGSGYRLDLEVIIGLKPDLIVGWKSGNNAAQLESLKKLGFNLYLSEPKKLQDIAKNLRDLGELLGEKQVSIEQSEIFLNGLSKLRKRNKQSRKVKVFYQVWEKPLFTVNGDHMISHIIDMCGGENIFKELNVLSPQVDIEAVIARNPDVIIAGAGESRENWLVNWEKWTSINAVKNKQLYGINADIIVRHSPRILQGANLICDALHRAR